MSYKYLNIGWQSSKLYRNSSIEGALESLVQSSLQIVLVVSEEDKLIGTITDGDVRRGLLSGATLDSHVDTIMNRKPFTVPPGLEKDKIFGYMQEKHIHHIPVIDADNRPIGLYIWENMVSNNKLPNHFIIMAGGKGTRLLPYTKETPKPMINIQEKPIMEHIIKKASLEGFNKYIISINYLGHQIEGYFGHGADHNVDITYLKENEPLGTAGSLSELGDRVNGPIIVTNGDVITGIRYYDILKFHIKNEAAATMAVKVHEIQNPFGVVETDGIDIVGFEEKPVYRSKVNAGIYVLDPQYLNLIAKNEFIDMPSFFEKIRIAGKKTIVFPLYESWLDIGTESDLKKAQGGWEVNEET